MLRSKKDSISLQDRDIALLRGLFECRVMTKDHVTALYFEGKGEAAKKRLQKLKAAKLISERPRRAFEPSILFLTRDGLVHRSTTCRSEGHSQPVTIEVNLRASYFSSKTPPPIPKHQTCPYVHLRSPTDGVWAAICQQVQQDIFGRAVLPFRALFL
jgi:hypothetical protein